jgi:hypothetical protein
LTGFVDDLLIEGNWTSGSVIEHGIYVSNSGDRPIIRRNVVWNNSRNGIHMNGDAEQDGDGIISEAVVEANTIYSNGADGGSGINCDGVQDSLIVNNLIYDTHASGISLYRIDGGGPSSGNLVINNTVVVASNGRWALNIQDDSADNEVFNNIFFNLHPSRGAISLCGAGCAAGFVSDYNVTLDRFTADDSTVLTVADWQAQTGQDAHSIVHEANAVFVDMANNDYRVSEASAARDVGTSLNAPVVDHDGNARPSGGAVDIGAFEYCDGACAPATGGRAGSGGNAGANSGGSSAGGSSAGGTSAGPGAGGAAGSSGASGSRAGSGGGGAVLGGPMGGTNANAAGAPSDAGQSAGANRDDGSCALKLPGKPQSSWALAAALALVVLGRRRCASTARR